MHLYISQSKPHMLKLKDFVIGYFYTKDIFNQLHQNIYIIFLKLSSNTWTSLPPSSWASWSKGDGCVHEWEN